MHPKAGGKASVDDHEADQLKQLLKLMNSNEVLNEQGWSFDEMITYRWILSIFVL